MSNIQNYPKYTNRIITAIRKPLEHRAAWQSQGTGDEQIARLCDIADITE